MDKKKIEQIFDLIQRMHDDIHGWMISFSDEVTKEGISHSRGLLEEAGAVLQEWKS